MTSGTGKKSVPEAKAAMDQMKYEVANEIGVPLKQGYNGDLTSAQNGYVGGYMVNIVVAERPPTEFKRWKKRDGSYAEKIEYTYSVMVG